LKEILKLADEILVIFSENTASPNSHAVNQVRFLCNQMRCDDSVINEKSRKIADHASMFFSLRQHENYRGGASFLYAEIKSLLAVIRRRVGIIEHMRNNPRAR